MSTDSKKRLLALTYGTTIFFMGLFAVIFAIFLGGNLTVAWARVIYYIWIAAIVINIAYDIMCVIAQKNKYISGIILYIISILTLAVSIILFFSFATDGIIIATNLFGYISCVFLSYFINALAIAIFCVGQRLITLRTYTE